MAAAFFNALADQTKARALSAGTEPGTRVHPEVMEVMRERGFDLSGATPQLLTSELAEHAQLLITMGCGDKCPYVPGAELADWPLDDPESKSVEDVRAIRDDIRERVRILVDEKGWARTR